MSTLLRNSLYMAFIVGAVLVLIYVTSRPDSVEPSYPVGGATATILSEGPLK